MLTFPLWVIRLPKPCRRGIRFLSDDEGYIYVFSSRDGALAVLVNRITAGMVIHWLRLEEAHVLIADMHDKALPGVCLNWRASDSCGELISLAQFAGDVHTATAAAE
jgi:hypothetical protein